MIKLLTEADRGVFVRLWKEALIDIAKLNPLVGDNIEALAFFSDIFHAYARNYLRGGTWVYETDGEAVAIIMAGESPMPLMWECEAGDLAHLWGAYTMPSYRRFGYQKQLGAHTVEVMRALKFKTFVTEVAGKNTPSIEIMDGLGTDLGAERSIVRYIMSI